MMRPFSMPVGQWALFFLLQVACIPVVLTTLEEGAVRSLLLFLFVASSGLWLCHRVQVSLADPKLRILGYFWLVKLALTFFLLYVGWIPELYPTGLSKWGYDPQRYYFDAIDLVNNNWLPTTVDTYQGILYYFGVIFVVFGHNPLNPALVNVFITLLGTLALIIFAYEIKGVRGTRDWTLAFALLLPEVVWYDTITSRESLAAVLVLLTLISVGRYTAASSPRSLFLTITYVTLLFLIIALIRTSMVVPLGICIMVLILIQKNSRVITKLTFLVFFTLALGAAPLVSEISGGKDFEYAQLLTKVSSVHEILNSQQNWSENSIGALLIPNNLPQAFLFLPPRAILYLVSPLPNVFVPISDLASGKWGAWQQLMTVASSILNVLVFPYVLGALVYGLRNIKGDPTKIMLPLFFCVTFIGVAGGNFLIVERYRIMASLLLWGSAWLGFQVCSRGLIRQMSFTWYGMLFSGALLYLGYKGLQ